MKICLITTRFKDSEYNFTFYKELVPRWLDKGHVVHIIDLEDNGGDTKISCDGVKNLHIHHVRGLFVPKLLNRVLLSVLAKRKIRSLEKTVDFFVAHDIHGFGLRCFIRKPFLVDAPTFNPELFKCMDLSRNDTREFISNVSFFLLVLLVSIVQYFTVRSASHVFTNCMEFKNKMVRSWGIEGSKITVISVGVDLVRFNSAHTGEFYLDKLKLKGKDVILTMSRISPIKGIRYLIEAFKKVSVRFPDSVLVIAGDGVSRMSLEKFVDDLGMGKRVIFTGWLDYCTQVPAMHAASDIFVLSSLLEGTPSVLLEAMASGKPVIATDVGGMSDIITDGVDGLLVKPKDVSGLAEKISLLLGNRELRSSLGAKARTKVEERFSWEDISKKVLDVYGLLADSASGV